MIAFALDICSVDFFPDKIACFVKKIKHFPKEFIYNKIAKATMPTMPARLAVYVPES